MNLKFIYTDDKTGKFSDTTLRTWILFFTFLITAILIGIAAAAITLGLIKVADIPQGVLSFFTTLGLFCLGGQGLYLGKRINEARQDVALFKSMTRTNQSDGGTPCSTGSTPAAK